MNITKPKRVTHTYRQNLCAPAGTVFPLLCPVRETEWADGWLPDLVISSTGVVERDCIFTTNEKFGTATWYVTRHEPTRWLVEMLKIIPGVTACRLEIQLTPNSDSCFADITYTYTSLGSAGADFLRTITADYYRRFMETWERELNHFLQTGSRLTDEAGL